jgi:hypothetical protein
MRRRFVIALALPLAGCGSTRAQRNSSAVNVAHSWDAFYRNWIAPIVHFGTPTLIVFALLLALSRALTPVMLTTDSPGPRGAKLLDRARMAGMYWLGVVALGWSAVEAVVIYPLGRQEPHAVWVAATSIVLIAASSAVVTTLYAVVGRPLRRQIYAPGVETDAARQARIHDYARIWLTMTISVVLLTAAAVCSAELYVRVLANFHVLNGIYAPLVYSPLLAVLGIVIVGRTRGIGLGLLIHGHDKAGSDDGGLGAFVRARLFALGSDEPGGIRITERTDVSTLPSEALSLIPEGTLAKAVQLLASLFTPATPWRVDVTEQSDGSVVVSLQRNGKVSDAVVIRPSVLRLPAVRSTDPGVATDMGHTDWTVELRTASASFILLALSRRYYHLAAGLSGGRDWRSVALQVIACDPSSKLGAVQQREMLARAVGYDGGNVAAELALLNATYGNAERGIYIGKLEDLLRRVSNEEGMTPLRLRIRFNIMIALINSAASGPVPPFDARPAKDASPDCVRTAQALEQATTQARRLLVFWGDVGNRREFPTLWRDMGEPIVLAARSIAAEWRRRFSDAVPHDLEEEIAALPDRQLTLLARYERACLLTAQASAAGSSQQDRLYREAFDDLEMAASVQSYRVGARQDPSFRSLHDVTEVHARYLAGADADRARVAEAAADAQEARNASSRAADDSEQTRGEKAKLRRIAEEKAHAAEEAEREVAGLDPAAFDPSAVVRRFKSIIGDPTPSTFLDLRPLAPYKDALEMRGIHTSDQLKAKAAELPTELSITQGVANRLNLLADLYEFLLRHEPATTTGSDKQAVATGMTFLVMQAGFDTVQLLEHAVAVQGAADLHRTLLDQSKSWDLVAPTEPEVASWQSA